VPPLNLYLCNNFAGNNPVLEMMCCSSWVMLYFSAVAMAFTTLCEVSTDSNKSVAGPWAGTGEGCRDMEEANRANMRMGDGWWYHSRRQWGLPVYE